MESVWFEITPNKLQYCCAFPDQKFFRAEDVAFDLQQKYHEYSRKKYKPFLTIVRRGLHRLNIKDGSNAVSCEKEGELKKIDVTDASSVIGENNEVVMLDVKETTGLSRMQRKRKAVSIMSSTPKVDDICTSNKHVFGNSEPSRHIRNSLIHRSNDKASDLSTVSKSSGSSNRRAIPVNSFSTIDDSKRGLLSVSTLTIEPCLSTVTFKDLGGCDRQFLEICRLAMHMKRPHTYNVLRVEPPKGFLVHGPPGCGKTLFAQAIAGQFNLKMIQLNATELVSGVSGESEEKVRKLFDIAKQNAPCVLIIDDIDVIAPKRETATREMERRIVSQLSKCLDELHSKKNQTAAKICFSNNGEAVLNDENDTHENSYVLVIGTTSRPDSVDGSLRRAGRFDCEIPIGIPDERARKEILQTICKLTLDDSVDMKMIARLTPGYVGADLKALVRETAKCAVERIYDTVVKHTTSKQLMTNDEVKAALEKAILWLQADDDPRAIEDLGEFLISSSDFERALQNIQPSAKREGFATVPNVSWQDVGALYDIRQELEWNILFPVKRPEDFALLGVSAKPQGILLCGPPGCGKTLLAKAIANETGLNFISVKGPELLNMYVGESERAVRTVFQRARDSSPCIIFFDEIDALCPKRSHNEFSGGSRLVNQLLTEMDGIEMRKQVFLIGATNRPDIVDPAILRPGRLDKILFVDLPSPPDRADILRKSTKDGTQPKIGGDVDFDELARLPELDGFTGADLAALVHEASIVALKERLLYNNVTVDAVRMTHFTEAIKNIRPSVTEADRKNYIKMKHIYSLGRDFSNIKTVEL
ncbi:ATPase, AAA family [Dictyocaulus viviparus]|uniref:ATPase, AAA family n=1 Tax=Dictyocaulus viviparus TaxID=29172 RepID=A0A0D8YBR4_DICVI|nr:ATPase, AAA family [Dictyocaulus viviparus]